ncbi:unnamed protein product [Didymodactylos carnosus]|uniref:START domain-containing protein n=1 Tax=Didymodactylos carnosus TaxID=1234261 RepID=A0A815CXA6_9BILA|nr:unnamed protein product [Didymodactylos carnosus]CAF1293621.1 unnamed protein product [Didymodactylos carnosus]CAF3495811.1 unnamed protein product [Didymodactylos carnosus]CAF4103932.1 unnamed protein product [Didymodactylos carnosus]
MNIVRSEFNGISAEILYDVIHDAQYRTQWDTAMLDGYELCSVSPNSDIGYYSYFGLNKEKYIINHSVNHVREPPKKGFVRGISYITGMLPAWAVNKASKILVPKLMKRLLKASLKYEKWKSKNNSNYRPWINPEQITVPRYSPADVIEFDKSVASTTGDVSESLVVENSVDMKGYENDD